MHYLCNTRERKSTERTPLSKNKTNIMRKTIQFAMLLCLSVLTLTGCKDTSAVKAAAEEAAKACPIALDNLGEATSITMGENDVAFVVKPLASLMENGKMDESLIARYLALELQRKAPELVKAMVDTEFGIKCNIDGEEGDILVAPEELKKFHGEFEAAGGKLAPILLPLYNQQLSSKLPMDIAEGLSLKKAKVVDGVQTFFIEVDNDKAKFEDVRGKIVDIMRKIEKSKDINKEFVAEKVKLSNINLSLLLPLLDELNYSTMFRYSTKDGSETFMEITADEIKALLAPAEEAAASE